MEAHFCLASIFFRFFSFVQFSLLFHTYENTYFGAFLVFLHLINYTFHPRYRWTTCSTIHIQYLVSFYSYLTCHTLIVKVKCLCFLFHSCSLARWRCVYYYYYYIFLSTRLIDGGEMLRIKERERKRHQKASCGMQSYLHSQSARLNI